MDYFHHTTGSVFRTNSKALIGLFALELTSCVTCSAVFPSVDSPTDSSSYLVAPKWDTTTKAAAATANTSFIEKEAEDVYEDSIPIDQIQPLLPFENWTAEATTDWSNEDDKVNARSAAATSKDKLNIIQKILLGEQQGDDLLTLRDPYAAIEWYEQALLHSSKVEVGGTIILNREGYPTIAHFDCIDQDQLHVAILQYSSSRSNPSQEVEEEEIEISSSILFEKKTTSP
jgi:hypothetical protein